MSCFVHDDAHINAIITSAKELKLPRVDVDDETYSFRNIGDRQTMAQMFLTENLRQYNFRYPSEGIDLSESITYQPGRKLTALELFKAAFSLRYQCEETNDYETTPTFKILTYIMQQTAVMCGWGTTEEDFSKVYRLPEFDQAFGYEIND